MQKHIIYCLLSDTHNIWNQKTDRETKAKTKAETDKHTNNQHFKYTSSYIQQTQTEACMHVRLPFQLTCMPFCKKYLHTHTFLHAYLQLWVHWYIQAWGSDIHGYTSMHIFRKKSHNVEYANKIPTSQSTNLPTYICTYLHTDKPTSDN